MVLASDLLLKHVKKNYFRKNQAFYLEMDNGYVRIRSALSDKPIMVEHSSDENGAPIIQWIDRAGDNEWWRLERI
jgi:hypothetical protein